MSKIFRLKKILTCIVAIAMLLSGIPVSASELLTEPAFYEELGIEEVPVYSIDYPAQDTIAFDAEEEPFIQEAVVFEEEDDADEIFYAEEDEAGSYKDEFYYTDGADSFVEDIDEAASDHFENEEDPDETITETTDDDIIINDDTDKNSGDDPESSCILLPETYDFTESTEEPLVGAGEINLSYSIISGSTLSTIQSKLRTVREYGIITKTLINNSNQRTNFATAGYNRESGNYMFTPNLAGSREIPFISRTTGTSFTINSGIPAPAVVHMQAAHNTNVLSEDSTGASIHKYYDSGDILTTEMIRLLQNAVDVSKTLNAVTYVGSINATTADYQNYIVDTTGSVFGANDFIVLYADDLVPYFSGNRLTIKKRSGQTIAFNTYTSGVAIGAFTVVADGVEYNSSSSLDESQNQALRSQVISKIIFNTRSINNLELGGTAGTFLVPTSDASVTLTEASSGTLAINGSLTANASWHFLNTDRSSTATIKVRKDASPATARIPIGQFAFSITPMNGGPMPSETTVTNALDGFATFPSIVFSNLDGFSGNSYIYRIQETGSDADDAWNINEFPVFAKVTIDRAGGASVKYYTDSKCTAGESTVGSVINTYGNQHNTIRLQLKVSSTLFVKYGFTVDETNKETFTFKLTPMDPTRTGDADTKSVVEKGDVLFKELTFEEPGEYIYEVTEQDNGSASYIYDHSVYRVTIRILEEEGQLVDSVDYTVTDENGVSNSASVIQFNNQFAPGPLTEKIKVKNTVSGLSGSNDTFKFILTRATNDNKVDELTIKGNGLATFKELSFGQPGTYTYRITEEAGSAGYIYDTSVYTVRVVITVNGSSLRKKVTYSKDKDDSYSVADFTNIFVRGAFSFYAVRSDSRSQGVDDAVFGIYGIKETDRSGNTYKSVANALSGGTVNYDSLTRIATYASESSGRVVFENLEPNTFYVIKQETPLPKGYQGSKKPIIIHTGYANKKCNVKIVSSGNGTITTDSSTGICKWLLQRSTVTVKSLRLGKSTYTVNKGKTLQLKAVITPSNATDRTLKWKSSNTKIVKVSSKGTITGVKKGTATVTVTSSNGKKASCKITVLQPVTSVKLNKSKAAIKKGAMLQLKATVLPSSASNKKVTWKSSNPGIAKVTNSGKVTGVKKGTATITAIANNGKKVTCKITVKN